MPLTGIGLAVWVNARGGGTAAEEILMRTFVAVLFCAMALLLVSVAPGNAQGHSGAGHAAGGHPGGAPPGGGHPGGGSPPGGHPGGGPPSGAHPGGGHPGGGGHGGWHGPGWYGPGWYGGVFIGGPWFYPYSDPYLYPDLYPYPYGAYSYPYAPAPYYAYPPPVSEGSSIYIEREPAPSAPTQAYWYYCASAKAYYPSVQKCPEPWIKVPPPPQ